MMPNRFLFLLDSMIQAITRTKMSRSQEDVRAEYSAGWERYAEFLDKTVTIENWLYIRGFEDIPRFQSIAGNVQYTDFDCGAYYRTVLLETISHQFPDAKSVTEYGCGIGRNLLFLKQRLPHLECYGYELTSAGVQVAAASVKKFGLPVEFLQLDFARSDPKTFPFSKTDIAFTMFALEQLPENNANGLSNILQHVRYGSIHIEPVPENYPYSFRGLIGRIDHSKANYVRHFNANVCALGLPKVSKAILNTSHNPLMFPSVYVLKKVYPDSGKTCDRLPLALLG